MIRRNAVDILVVTNSCSQKKYEEICKMRIKPIIDPQQKFCRLMISGLSEANNGNVTAVSALPVSASTVAQKVFPCEEETDETGVIYRYLPFRNGKITRYLSLISSTRKSVKEWCKAENGKKAAVIVDPLNPVLAIPARKIAQKYGIKACAVVTDIPSLCTKMKQRKENLIKKLFLNIYQKISDSDMKAYDAYIPLTESINEKANPKGKPYAVVEGFADSKDTDISEIHENYIMYAGGVYEKYGVKALAEAFVSLNRQDIQLYIFGDGTYVEEIKKLQSEHPNIRYMGCLSPEEVVAYEKKALLLVNPRPVNEEFSKYSFPSKTMEYMLSGTPVVSTKLPGIPKEYFDYIYSFEKDDCAGIADKLNDILRQPGEAMIQKGQAAHDFVKQCKNNVVMAGKIIGIISGK